MFFTNISDTLSKSYTLFQNGIESLFGTTGTASTVKQIAVNENVKTVQVKQDPTIVESSTESTIDSSETESAPDSDSFDESLPEELLEPTFDSIEEMVDCLRKEGNVAISHEVDMNLLGDPHMAKLNTILNNPNIPDNWWSTEFEPRVMESSFGDDRELLIYAPDIDVCRMHRIYRSILVHAVHFQLSCLSNGHDMDQAAKQQVTRNLNEMIELAKELGMEMEDIQQWESFLNDFKDGKE